jgi:hypothetical protein
MVCVCGKYQAHTIIQDSVCGLDILMLCYFLQELATFALFIVQKFIEVATTNSKVYMELLFWKTARDAYDIEQGYGSYQEK